MSFLDRWIYPREPDGDPLQSEMRQVLRRCYDLSRAGCFSRKRSERDKALADINRITEKYR